jgi:acyl-CoA dehydrogenase
VAFDFSLSPDVEEQRRRIADFVAAQVVPIEQQAFHDGVTDALRVELQALARSAGIFAPQAPRDLGGGGFRFDDAGVLLEEAGYSLLGPLALNCAAPDEGNIHLIHQVGTPEQHEAYLRPLVCGDVRSCFSMTEPPPGAGDEPLLTLDHPAAPPPSRGGAQRGRVGAGAGGRLGHREAGPDVTADQRP